MFPHATRFQRLTSILLLLAIAGCASMPNFPMRTTNSTVAPPPPVMPSAPMPGSEAAIPQRGQCLFVVGNLGLDQQPRFADEMLRRHVRAARGEDRGGRFLDTIGGRDHVAVRVTNQAFVGARVLMTSLSTCS